jgi:hypothetical protein
MKKLLFISILLMVLTYTPGAPAPSDYGDKENIAYNPCYNNTYYIVNIINDKTVYAMEPNFWNVNSSIGIVNMSYDYDGNTLNCYANVSNIAVRNIWGYVNGYSEIMYGRSPWANYVINKENGTQFPLYVKDVKNKYDSIYIDVNYSINNYSDGLPMDFSFDFWLTNHENETSVGLDDAEFMIWLYSNNLSPSGNMGYITMPMYVNGTLVNNSWKIAYQKPQYRWAYIAFISNETIKKGDVRIDLIPFINKTMQILINDTDGIIKNDDLYLQGCELGFEFGKNYVVNNTNITTKNATFNWSIYNFEVNAMPSKPDISITNIQAPNQTVINQTCVLNISIKNLGCAVSNASLSILAQLNGNLTINETKYFNLSNNGSSIFTINYTPKENGTLYILAEAHLENGIIESNESNNNKTISISISTLESDDSIIPTDTTLLYDDGSSHYHPTATITTKTYKDVAEETTSEGIVEIAHKSKLIVGSEIDNDLSAKQLKDTVELITQPLEIKEDCILVGGPVANPLVKKYVWAFKVKVTNEYPGVRKGIIQKQLINGHTVFLLAGSDRWGTKAAVEYFKTLDDLPDEPIFIEWNYGKAKKL